jgi:triacylglycerol esterase/lipase EstA (alpha/beta hydrolase family)
LYGFVSNFNRFSHFDVKTNENNDVFDVDVSYGKYFDYNPETGPETSYAKSRRRAILFSQTPEIYEHWSWSEEHKVHFICHSQGGNTGRYLVSLMDRGAGKLHPEYFGVGGRDKWIVSMTTLGTPHRGTTVINVLENLVQVCLLCRTRSPKALQC